MIPNCSAISAACFRKRLALSSAWFASIRRKDTMESVIEKLSSKEEESAATAATDMAATADSSVMVRKMSFVVVYSWCNYLEFDQLVRCVFVKKQMNDEKKC